MPILLARIKSSSRHGTNVRCKFSYTLSDGREITIGPVNARDEADAAIKLLHLRDRVLSKVRDRDSEEAATMGLDSAHGEATHAQVRTAWLKRGLRQSALYEAYFYMKDIAPHFASMTNEEIAAYLGVTAELVGRIKNKWAYLSSNSAVIEAYANLAADRSDM